MVSQSLYYTPTISHHALVYPETLTMKFSVTSVVAAMLAVVNVRTSIRHTPTYTRANNVL